MFKTIATLSLLFSLSSFAQTANSNKIQFVSKTVAVEDFEVNQLTPSSTLGGSITDILNPLNEVNIVMDQIVNMGQRVWNIVAKGKPVVNYQQYTASALPSGIEAWQQMQGWAGKAITQEISVINGFGTEKVKFVYRVVFLYNGNVNGTGKYLGYATIEPANIKVGWGGYTFNAQVAVPEVFNMGTSANPIAGMKIQVKYSVDTIVQHDEYTDSFFITGSGKLQAL